MRCQMILWDVLASAVACTYPNSKKDAGGGMVVRSELAVGLGDAEFTQAKASFPQADDDKKKERQCTQSQT